MVIRSNMNVGVINLNKYRIQGIFTHLYNFLNVTLNLTNLDSIESVNYQENGGQYRYC